MDLTIIIDKSKIYSAVQKQIEYIASRTDKFDSARVVDEDEELLDEYFAESLLNVADALKDFATDETVENNVVLHFEAEPPLMIQRKLRTAIERYCVNYISSWWLTNTLPEKTQPIILEMNEQMKIITQLAYTRPHPTRPTV